MMKYESPKIKEVDREIASGYTYVATLYSP